MVYPRTPQRHCASLLRLVCAAKENMFASIDVEPEYNPRVYGGWVKLRFSCKLDRETWFPEKAQ
jgi:hypothetical protein